MQIFLSYGHDEYKGFAERLKADLEAENLKVFMDNNPALGKLCGGDDWEIELERGIEVSNWMVLLMTQHSVRRPDGFCLNEVAYARNAGKPIVPIMVQQVNPPLSIARIQYIDMEGFFRPALESLNEDAYEQKKTELIEILKGLSELRYEGTRGSLSNHLNPIDNDVYSDRYRNNFYGREKLFEICDEWMQSDSRILWISGDAGTGKTAFIAELTQRKEDIAAVHFCRYNDNERSDPKRALMSLAYYVSTQLPDYRSQLESLKDVDKLLEKNTTRLFEYLFVEPFSKLPADNRRVVLIVDALDEATTSNEKNELLDVLSSDFKRLPSWVKLIVTSRNVSKIKQKFSREETIDITEDKWGDIKGYIRHCIKSELEAVTDSDEIVDILNEKSAGNFLYAKLIVDDIKHGDVKLDSIDDFPNGLSGIYHSYFERILVRHPEIVYKANIRPILNVLCTICAPLKVELICEITGLDEDDFDDAIEAIRELFPQRNSTIEPIHKSIYDWLSDKEMSGPYHVNKKKGHVAFVDYFMNLYNKNRYKSNDPKEKYTLRYLCHHLLGCKRFEEATELLSNAEYQNERIKQIGLDTAVRTYINEIALLHEQEEEKALSVFVSDTFIDLFTAHRKFFYNSGLYFSVKNCGFDDALQVKTYEQFELETKVGIINYRYITEAFEETIVMIETMLQREIPVDYQAELYNILALCYRKKVYFTESEMYFRKGFEMGEGRNYLYDQSVSLVNLGKITYHQLDWRASYEWTEKALEYLEREFQRAKEMGDNDYAITLELFIAEYHRLYAESLIWDFQIERTVEELMTAEVIYQRLNTRDRYYVRFLYTSTFSHLLTRDFEKVLEECDDIIAESTSKYDKSQILFYRCIALASLDRKEELEKCVLEAAEFARSIGAWLEYEEIVLLGELVLGEGKFEHCESYAGNDHIQRWLPHVKAFVKKIIE